MRVGIKEQVGHIKDELDASVIFMNSIFPSGGQDTGYDVTNHTAVDPVFGTVEDFEAMMKSFHKKGIKCLEFFVLVPLCLYLFWW